MKIFLILTLILSFEGMLDLYGQTALEKAADRLNISINMPTYLTPSQNEKEIYVTEITKEDPVPTLEQSYNIAPSFGKAALKVIFGMVGSIITHKDEEYVLFVSISPGRSGGSYGKIVTDSTELLALYNIPFGGIKSNFRYGDPFSDASELEADELYSMLKHHPHEQAKEMFNANAMVSYPISLRNGVYKDKYTRCRVVKIGKERYSISLYFLMTDKSVRNFDTYLKDLTKVFWFNEMSDYIKK